ncbi:MAG: phosphodiester glycosidase family protein [Bacilli bacterium]
MVVKKFFGIMGKFLSFLLLTVLGVFVLLLLTINLFCNGPSNKARELFVTTFLETGQMKFVVSIFLDDKEIKEIVDNNSLQVMDDVINPDLITVDKTNDLKENIEVVEIPGNSFTAKMMIVKDPSTISLATTYPWTEYGVELDKLVKKSNAVAGINGGLYVSASNKGGRPLGLTVSGGEILHLNVTGLRGVYLIGLDQNNLLRIIDLAGKNNEQVKNIIINEKIRDAVAFQEEASDKNNHFVKLIINGEKRVLNGLGSGANPRTAIGQRKDGSILLLVTDGRGASGHLGATAGDLIDIMHEYGALNAANLDGGSSSSMYYKDAYLMTSVTLYHSNSSWKLPTAFVVKEK